MVPATRCASTFFRFWAFPSTFLPRIVLYSSEGVLADFCGSMLMRGRTSFSLLISWLCFEFLVVILRHLLTPFFWDKVLDSRTCLIFISAFGYRISTYEDSITSTLRENRNHIFIEIFGAYLKGDILTSSGLIVRRGVFLGFCAYRGVLVVSQ